MAIMEGSEPTLIAKMDRPNAHVATWVGKHIDVHCTASGKCLIAHLPEKEMERLVQTRGMLRHNENTICSINRLKTELARIRELGYGVDDEEEEIGVRCIGAPVFDSKGRVVAAISISGPSERIDVASQQHLISVVKETAAEISRKLRELPDLGLTAGAEPEPAAG
jgi:DNA-binding IclR family transcriptional regulator